MSSAAAFNIVRDTSRALSCELPAGLVAAIEEANNLIAAAESLGSGAPAELHRVVLACLQRGGDPTSDKAVLKALAAQQLSTTGTGMAARELGERDIAESLVTFADELLSAWSSSVQSHLDTLVAQAADLPENLQESAGIIAHGGDQLQSWAACQEALRLTRAATTGAATLARIARIAITRDRQPLLIAPADPDGFDAVVRDTGRQVDTWQAARAGMRLQLVDSLGALIESLTEYDRLRQAAITAAVERERHPGRALAR